MGISHLVIILLTAAPTFSHNIPHQTGHAKSCRLRTLGDAGSCVSLKDCPAALQVVRELNMNSAKEFILERHQDCGNVMAADQYPIICCIDGAPDLVTESHSDSLGSQISTIHEQERPPTTPGPSFRYDAEVAPKAYVFCKTPDLQLGVCKPIKQCTRLLDRLMANSEDNVFKNYLRASNQNCGSLDTNVCCVESMR